MPKQKTDPEVLAMSRIVRLMNPLTKSEQGRIIRYLQARYAQIEIFTNRPKPIDGIAFPPDRAPLPCPHDKDDTGADPNANEKTGNSEDPMPWDGEENAKTV